MLEKEKKIMFSPPDIGNDEIQEVVDTLKSGWLTTGPKTKKFETKIAQYIGVEKAVCLNSATSALELTLRILGVGPGDEVITSAYTYTASASVIQHTGAQIVLVDTAKDSYEMDYDKLEDAITSKTKVIIPVDIAGRICNYDKIYEIVKTKRLLFNAQSELQKKINRITILADAAHSFGARRNNKISGLIADFTCFSFHAVKNLTTGEGGAVVWNPTLGLDSELIYKEYMLYSLHGQSKDALEKSKAGSWEYDIIYPGYKCNMTDLSASIGLIQLEKYDNLLKKRKELTAMYDNELDNLNVTSFQHTSSNFSSSNHLYIIRIPNISEEIRNKILIKLSENGIPSNVHYKPLPMLTAYKNLGFKIENFPNSYEQYKNSISLPLHTQLNNDDIRYISGVLKVILKENFLYE